MSDEPTDLVVYNPFTVISGDKLKLWNKLTHSHYFLYAFGETDQTWRQVVPPSNGYGYPKEEPSPRYYYNLQHPDSPKNVVIDSTYVDPGLVPVMDGDGKPANITYLTPGISPGLRALLRLMKDELEPVTAESGVSSREYWLFLGTEFG